MFKVERTTKFSKWLKKVKDPIAKAQIAIRIQRMEKENFGDHDSVGDGVSELRINIGKGYRVYYTIRGRKIIILLCGGIKSSQDRDIKEAKKLASKI